MRTCPQCGTEFDPVQLRGRPPVYCGPECKRVAVNGARCVICSNPTGAVEYPVPVHKDANGCVTSVRVCDRHGYPPLDNPDEGRRWVNDNLRTYWNAALGPNA